MIHYTCHGYISQQLDRCNVVVLSGSRPSPPPPPLHPPGFRDMQAITNYGREEGWPFLYNNSVEPSQTNTISTQCNIEKYKITKAERANRKSYRTNINLFTALRTKFGHFNCEKEAWNDAVVFSLLHLSCSTGIILIISKLLRQTRQPTQPSSWISGSKDR